jgi:hypothetical protein
MVHRSNSLLVEDDLLICGGELLFTKPVHWEDFEAMEKGISDFWLARSSASQMRPPTHPHAHPNLEMSGSRIDDRCRACDVRFGSFADIGACVRVVRFVP